MMRIGNQSSLNAYSGTFSPAPSSAQIDQGKYLTIGHRGPAVERLQQLLVRNNPDVDLEIDGFFGAQTLTALKEFQRTQGLEVDGLAGPVTHQALITACGPLDVLDNNISQGNENSTDLINGLTPPEGTILTPANHTATFDEVLYAGARHQRVDGRITINGHTYQFRSGGRGRGNLPAGEYTVTRHLDYRSDKPTMMVDGEGYSFALTDKYDPRVRDTRTLLRIHPDGLGPGTIGCIGIVGDAAVQRRFRTDMLAELQRNGGSINLKVGV